MFFLSPKSEVNYEMNVFNKIQSHFFYKVVKDSYTIVFEAWDKERIYYKNNKFVIEVINDQLGYQVYEIVSYFKDSNIEIETRNAIFKVDQISFDKHKRVQWFSVDLFQFGKRWKSLLPVDKLKEFVSFVEKMRDKGFFLDSSKYEYSKCKCISEVLSLFIRDESEAKHSTECVINFVHSFFNKGESLKYFYDNFVSQKSIFKFYEFPYSLPIVRMCYEYYESGIVPERVSDILEEEDCKLPLDYYLISTKHFENNYSLVDENQEYSIYSGETFFYTKDPYVDEKYIQDYSMNGKIKIFHQMNSDYKKYFNDSYFVMNNRTIIVGEHFDNVIVDLNGTIIGYLYSEHDCSDYHSIINFDKEVSSQKEVFDFLKQLINDFRILNDLMHRNDEINIRKSLNRLKLSTSFSESSNEEIHDEYESFDIEKSVVYKKSCDLFEFKMANISDVIGVVKIRDFWLRKKITFLFFKLFLSFITQKYEEECKQGKYLEIQEVRVICPVLVREFVNFALDKEVDYQSATEAFFNFLNSCIHNSEFCYDLRFEFDPLEKPFLFDYEAEKEYNLKIEKGMKEDLPDGSKLVIYKKSKPINYLSQKIDSIYNDIHNKIGDIEDEHVKLVGISKVIYSSELNDDNMYTLIGYVSEPIFGEYITNEFLLGLSNKDLYKVIGYLFMKFDENQISFNSISMDKDFVFYIDILNKNYEIFALLLKYHNDFYKVLLKYLTKIVGCNPNAFVEIEDYTNSFLDSVYNSAEYWISLSNSLDVYCNEHEIFFDSHNGFCPICAKTKFLVIQDYEKKYTLVFEDSLAKHYRLDENNHLKVYKMLYDNIIKAEKNIDGMIAGKLDVSKFQECFLPVKKALNESNQFVGYVYKAVIFDENVGTEELCIDLKDTKQLTNLPRIKSLMRLMTQVKEMLDSHLKFCQNPFSHVFLSPNHKKQVQILNLEFLSDSIEIESENTLKWVCDYVFNVLKSDENIEFNKSDYYGAGSDNIADLSESKYLRWFDFLFEKMQYLSSQMTRYCSTHKMYYKNSYIFCPRCVDKKIIKHLPIRDEDESEYQNKEPINQGGESFIYSYGEDSVIKVFKKDAIDLNKKLSVLIRILSKKDMLVSLNKKGNKYEFVIPIDLVRDKNSQLVFAYVMKEVKGESISLLKFKDEVGKLNFSQKDVLEILITIGKALELLHQVNIYIGDLNGRNILFDENKKVYFIDFDGIGVDEIVPEFCTDMYIDPVSKKNKKITMEDDWYSFAIQAFHYLTYVHPFNGLYFVNENGQERKLRPTEMMEQRISLLGNHGIEVPEVAQPWDDWMIEELKTAFFETFEGEKRESIVPELIKQYKKLFFGKGGQEDFPFHENNQAEHSNNLENSKTLSLDHDQLDHNTYRINSKFTANEINLFDGTVEKVFNEYSAVCEKDGKKALVVIVKENGKKVQKKINVDCNLIEDVLLSEDEKLAFVIKPNRLRVVDILSDNVIYVDDKKDIKNVVVNERKLYFLSRIYRNSSYYWAMFKRNFIDNEEVKEDVARLDSSVLACFFAVNHKNDVMMVNHCTLGKDLVYFNNYIGSLSKIDSNSKDSDYRIIYDKITKLWLVINSEGIGKVIEPKNKQIKDVNIMEILESNEVNIVNICFRNGIIYIPSYGYLFIVDVRDQVVIKKMECQKIMTPDSKLFNFNAKGFSVIHENNFYEVRKG